MLNTAESTESISFMYLTCSIPAQVLPGALPVLPLTVIFNASSRSFAMSVASLPVLGFLAAILGLLLSPWRLLPAALLYLAWGICFMIWAFSQPEP